MKSKLTNIETPLSPRELSDKLRTITITDFSQLHQLPNANYYGEITSYTFDIMDVHYGPMSSVPPIQGEIQEGVNNTIVSIKMDIQSHHKLTRNMCYSTLLPIGLIVMLLSALVLGGTEYQLHGFIFSVSLIICTILVEVLTKWSLINTKKREIKNFALRIGGKIISEQ